MIDRAPAFSTTLTRSNCVAFSTLVLPISTIPLDFHPSPWSGMQGLCVKPSISLPWSTLIHVAIRSYTHTSCYSEISLSFLYIYMAVPSRSPLFPVFLPSRPASAITWPLTSQETHGEPSRFDFFARSSHLRLPTRVSKCGATDVTSCPAATMVLRILLRYASNDRCRNRVRPENTLL